jgi:hypothetical protein
VAIRRSGVKICAQYSMLLSRKERATNFPESFLDANRKSA